MTLVQANVNLKVTYVFLLHLYLYVQNYSAFHCLEKLLFSTNVSLKLKQRYTDLMIKMM